MIETATVAGPAGPLRVGWARPAGGPARGTVLALQGRAEFIEKYGPFAEDALSWGYAFLTLDWRGQGGSARLLPDPRKGHVDAFEGFLDDLDAAVAHGAGRLGLPSPFLPVGLSMGGQVTLRALGDGRLAPPAAVLVAPMFGIDFGGWPPPVARAIALGAARLGLADRFAPGQSREGVALPAFEGNRLTADPSRFAGWLALEAAHAPLAIGGVTYGWLAAAVRSMALAASPAYLGGIEVPLLVAIAGDESIVSNRATEAALAHLRRARPLRFPGARHDLFLAGDADRARLMAAIRDHLDAATAPPRARGC